MGRRSLKGRLLGVCTRKVTARAGANDTRRKCPPPGQSTNISRSREDTLNQIATRVKELWAKDHGIECFLEGCMQKSPP